MNKFDRYVLKIYIKYIIMVQAFILGVSTFISAMSHLDGLKKYNVSFNQLVKLEFLTLPMGINSILPITVVVSGIVTILLLMRNKELLAYVSLGGRIQRLLMPFIAASILTSFLMITFDNYLYPKVRFRQQRFRYEEIMKIPYTKDYSLVNMWLMDERKNIIHIKLLDPIENTASGIKKYIRNKSMMVTNIINIENAAYEDGIWKYSNVSNTDITSIPPATELSEEYSEQSKFLNDLTSISGRSPKELSPKELAKVIKIMKSQGRNTTRYEMLMGSKIANALSVIVLTLLVIPMGINFSRNYSPLKSAIWSFALSGGFWAVMAACSSFGTSGVIPSFAANYAPHIIFLILGIFLLKMKERLA